ncbi:EamA family transporter [Colwellia psychrerythraea]|uniref:EamA family transporter n=1 Tax=Colwellia psychrerythraea TaxID=28229 RepID=A0A1Y5DXA5_COLPS|nr:EamA family transporter [Colwellia psychrerythraea]
MTVTSPRIATILLLIVCFIWGVEFVPIDLAIEVMPTNTFNAIRFAVATLSMLPLLWFVQKKNKGAGKPIDYVLLIRSGMLLGFFLFIGFYTQTEGMRFTTVTNAGFITGLCVPLVPVLGFLIFRNVVPKSVWIGVITATAGLYMLTIGDKLAFNKGDILVLICAFGFAGHIIMTDRFVDNLPIIPLSIVQIFAVSLYSTIAIFISPDPAFYYQNAEPVSWHQQLFTPLMMFAILVSGILGTAYAFWAQSVSQTLLKPHKVALIFAAEPVFACIAAWVFLDEVLGEKGMIGAGLILAGMLVSELGDRKKQPELRALDQTAALK